MHSRERCGAHARTTGKPYQAPARENGRCKLHGGLSKGPKTAEGWARIAAAQRERWARIRQLESELLSQYTRADYGFYIIPEKTWLERYIDERMR